MKLVFASPSYGAIEPVVVIGQRLAIMHAYKHAGVEWVGDCSPNDVKLSTVDQARNRIAKEAVEYGADAVFWCDSDIVLPQSAITELAMPGKDFITGIYCMRRPPYYPVVTRHDPDVPGFPDGGMNWLISWPPNSLMAIDACGFGCVLTSTKMLEAMGSPQFAFTSFSEDFAFCRKAAKAGFQLYVNTAVLCQHVGDRELVSVDTFKNAWKDGMVGPQPSLLDSVA